MSAVQHVGPQFVPDTSTVGLPCLWLQILAKLQQHADRARFANAAVARDERKADAPSRGADQNVEGIAVEPEFVGHVDLLGGQIEWLIAGVAEQIVEELPHCPAQTDTGHAGEQAAFPNDSPRHIKKRFLAFAAIVEGGRLFSETTAA